MERAKTSFKDWEDAIMLVNKLQLDAWVKAGKKRYPGQAKLQRIVDYLWLVMRQ